MRHPALLEERAIARLGETLLRDFENVPIDVVARVYNAARRAVAELDVEPAHRLSAIDCIAREELSALSSVEDVVPPRVGEIA